MGVQKSVLREIPGDPDVCLTLKATALSQLYPHYVVPWISKRTKFSDVELLHAVIIFHEIHRASPNLEVTVSSEENSLIFRTVERDRSWERQQGFRKMP